MTILKSIDNNYILERIGVQPPYYALNDLELDEKNGTMSAKIPIEQFSEMERSPITAAESGRHLAILGCCLLGVINSEEGKFYYLASSAVYEANLSIEKINAGNLVGYVSGNFTKRREAEAKAQLKTIDEELLCDLSLGYHVFPEKIFERFFRKYKHPLTTRPKDFNPYKNIPGFTSLEISEDRKTLNTTLDKLLPESCLGHFPMYSAVPIAILAHYLISASGHLLKKMTDATDLRYRVKTVNLSAPQLCFATERLSLEICFQKKEEGEYTFQGIANADTNKCVGEMTIVLTVLN